MVADSGPLTGGRLARAGLAVVAAGAAAGLAAEFHLLGWTSVPGNGCGGRYSPCPDGTTPTLVLAFLLTFAGYIALLITIGKLTDRRPGKVLPAVLATTGVVLVLWPGWQAYLWMRGPVLDTVWKAGHDRPSTVLGEGVWVVGTDDPAVVRVRTDALVAYDAHDGGRRWALKAPTRTTVCGMSDTVVDGIGLVAFGRDGKPCDTLWGVDPSTGRTVWKRTVAEAVPYAGGDGGLLAADAGVAVALTQETVQGYGLTDGVPRWTAELTGKGGDESCAPDVVSAAGGTTRVVVTCTEDGATDAKLVVLDTATGKQRDSLPLPVESPLDTATVVSAEPFTLLLEESDERGVAAVLSYPEDGADPVEIPLTADEEDLVVAPGTGGEFDARPTLWAAVEGNVLVVAARKPGANYPARVSGYSLRDGRRVWHTDLGSGNDIAALAPEGSDRGRVAVLGDSGRLFTLDAADGSRVGEDDGIGVRGLDFSTVYGRQLVRAGDTWVLVNANGGGYPPALGIR
ncbi:PQQ-binding-like beta-propeller repeat protein [Streptomyces sp. NPDC003247]|uniref:outer membrane protein assembly factor BamB family protein n=1 Tax=Streptomyces sp. NPDC003247 TaxID=3364677 RepID=UPI003680659F